MKIGLIIFDFDGVLADSFDSFFSLTKEGLLNIGLKLTPTQYRNFFIGNVHQGIKDFIKDENKYLLFSKFRGDNYEKYYHPSLFPGSIELIKKFNRKYYLAIASSGIRGNIVKLLKNKQIDNKFKIILATNEYTKGRMINKILSKLKFKPGETTMITDTVGDIKIAKKIGLKTIAATWGFHDYNTLLSAKPNLIVKSFRELERLMLTD